MGSRGMGGRKRRAALAFVSLVFVGIVLAVSAAPAGAGTAPDAFFNPTGSGRNVALSEAGAAVVEQSSGSPIGMINFDSADSGWSTTAITNQFVKFSLAEGGTWLVDRIRLMPHSCCSNRVRDFAVDVSATDSLDASFTNVLTATAANNGLMQEFLLPQPVFAKYVRYRPLTNWGSCCSIVTRQLKVMSGQHSTASTFTFQNLSTDPEGDIVSHAWDFGDGNTSIDTSPTHTYAAAGGYTVSLTVTDLEGNTDAASLVVRVLSAPAVSFTMSPAVPNEGQSVSFCDTSTDADGTIIRRTWSWGDGSGNATTTATCFSHSFGDNATYTVGLTVVDSQETSTAGSNAITPLNVPPSVNVFVDRRWVSGERLAFGISVSDPGFNDTRTCVWDHGDASTPRSNCFSFDHTYSVPFGSPAQTFTARLTATDDDGGVGSDATAITIYPQVFDPIPSAAIDATAVDWSRTLNRLVVTKGGTCVNQLALVALDGTSTPPITGDLTNGCAEPKLAVSPGAGGFAPGDIYLGNGNVGQILRVRMDANGGVLGVDNPWATVPTTSGRFNGGLAFDDVGAFGGDLLAVLSDGKVYRVRANATSTLVANFNRFLEGADVAGSGFGPASGCVLTTDAGSKQLLAACPGGTMLTLASIPATSSLSAPAYVAGAGDLFFGSGNQDRLYRGDARTFGGSLAGHTLVATSTGGEIWDVSYDAGSGTYVSALYTLSVHGASADTIEQLAFLPVLASPNTTLTPATASLLVGDTHTVTASVVDASGNPVAGLELTFDVSSGPNAGVSGAAVTDSSGAASFSYAGTAGPGTDAIVARSFNTTSVVATATWAIRPTVLVADPAVGRVGVPGGLQEVLGPRATLTDGTTGAPVAGRTISFTTVDPTTGAEVVLCAGTTDAGGVATCGGLPDLLAILSGQGYTAAFAGDTTYAAASDDAALLGVTVEE